MRITDDMRALEARYDKPIRQVLTDAYNRHGALAPAAEELGIHFTTLSRWFSGLDIEIRTQSVAVPTTEDPTLAVA